MAHTYIDNLAFPSSSDDGPHASAWLKRVRGNLIQANLDRCPKVGITYRASGEQYDRTIRACSYHPTARGPFWIWVPEESDSVTMLVRLESIVWSAQDASPPAAAEDGVRLAITPWQLGLYNKPTSDQWETYILTNTAQTAELSCDLHGMKGWVGVLLWVWSYSQLEDGATDQPIVTITPMGGIMIDSDAATRFWRGIGAINYPPERAVGIIDWVDGTKGDEAIVGNIRQVCSVLADGVGIATEDVLITCPPASDFFLHDGDPQAIQPAFVAWYTMGVAVISGLSLEVTPRALPLPGPASYYTAAPVEEDSHESLIAVAKSLGVRRVPTLSCHQGQYDSDGIITEWPIYSEARTTDINVVARTIASCLVDDWSMPTINQVGWRAVAAVFAQYTQTARGDAGFAEVGDSPIHCLLTLTVWDILAGAAAASHTTAVDIQLHQGFSPWAYDPIAQTMFYANGNSAYQFRGALCDARLMGFTQYSGGGTPSDGLDLGVLQVVGAECLCGTPTYPVELRLSLTTAADLQEFDLMLVSAGFAALDYAPSVTGV